MIYKNLGSTDIKISALCVGCMSFGERFEDFHLWTLPYDESKRIIDHALDLGINFFDTANCYAHGTSEEFLGKALASVPRDKVVVASKVYFNEGHLSKEAIEREINRTLKRLNMDYLDLYIIHRFDKTTPIEETMSALDSLVKAGKVRALGASAMYGYQFYNMQLCARDNGLTPFSSMQNHYNLLYREDERDLIPICKQMNVSLTPYSPLAAGRVARPDWESSSLRSQSDKVAKAKYDGTEEADKQIAKSVYEVAQNHGVTMAQIALAWHYAKGVTAPIIGSTKISEYDDAVKAMDISLTEKDIKALEAHYLPHKVMGAI